MLQCIYSASLRIALLCIALLCFVLLCVALHCIALLSFALLCSCLEGPTNQAWEARGTRSGDGPARCPTFKGSSGNPARGTRRSRPWFLKVGVRTPLGRAQLENNVKVDTCLSGINIPRVPLRPLAPQSNKSANHAATCQAALPSNFPPCLPQEGCIQLLSRGSPFFPSCATSHLAPQQPQPSPGLSMVRASKLEGSVAEAAAFK